MENLDGTVQGLDGLIDKRAWTCLWTANLDGLRDIEPGRPEHHLDSESSTGSGCEPCLPASLPQGHPDGGGRRWGGGGGGGVMCQ